MSKFLSFDPYKQFEDQIHSYTGGKGDDSRRTYFMSIILRRKHNKATRKVASFGIAIGSKYKILENMKPVVLKYLNKIFDSAQGDPKEE